jgi:YD repeat-containing protein
MLMRALIVGLFLSSTLMGMTVNRLNGGGTILYVDFSIAGPSVPLELSRGYNTITALSEKSGWKGAFGWGWTSPFETTMTTTPDRQVVLRDGGSGNTVFFRSQNQTKGALDEFMVAFKKAYFEQQKGQKLTSGELQSLNLPATLDSKLRTDPKYRARMSSRYKIPVNLTSGQKFISSEYGLQTIEYQNNRWIRTKNGIVQTFDEKGRLVRQADKNGYYFDFIYPAPDSFQISEIHDANKGMALKFKWELNRVAQITDNRNARALYRYDAVGNLSAVTDSSGQTYVYKYENKKFPHLLTRIDYPSESKSGKPVFREFRYDSDGLIAFVREKDGAEVELSYGRSSSDAENNFWTKSLRKVAGTKAETYEEFELKKRADGGKYLYRQTTRSNGSTNVSIFSECCGQPLEVTQNGLTTQFTYYPDGLVKTRTSSQESASFEYDLRWKKPIKVTQPGMVSKYEYDSRGNLVRASNSNKQAVSLKYDSLGRVQTLTNEQKRVFTFNYRDSAKPSLITESGVGSIELDYGPDGRLMSARTIASKARKPINSEQMVKKVQQGFQQLLNILRPAGLSDFRLN